MPRRPVEKLSRSLRRQAQIRAWQSVISTSDPSIVNDNNSNLNSNSSKEIKKTETLYSSSTPITTTTNNNNNTSINFLDNKNSIIQANYSLREALARGSPETKLTRQIKKSIINSKGKEEALEAFQLLLNTDGESPTEATFKTLSVILLQHHMIERLGYKNFQKSLNDVKGSDNERWNYLTEEERAIFINYTCRSTERWVERGSSYNKNLGFSQEGTDNAIISQLEYQMRKSGLNVSPSSLIDLMHLDITWSSALRLYNYAKTSPFNTILPPMEMTDRLIGLMTGYKSIIGGSRPWKYALQIYNEVINSEYETTLTTHTHALDALWRSADTFHRVHSNINTSHQEFIYEQALLISQRVRDNKYLITGEEGCAYAEALVKSFAAAGQWSLAVSLISNLDTKETEASFRNLIPTPETYAFAIAACHVAGNASHGEALFTIMCEIYNIRSLHSEVLTIFLESFRHVLQTSPIIGSIIEELINDGKGLERNVAVACLQLLSSVYVKTKQSRSLLASKLFDMYDANPWPQQPLVRKMELQTVFRCCHLIVAMETPNKGIEGGGGGDLLKRIRNYLITVFGNSSPEVEWLDDTSIYALQTINNISQAIQIYNTTIFQRKREHIPLLPIPLRQAKYMFIEALLRSCKYMLEDDTSFLIDEDAQEVGREAALKAIHKSIQIIYNIFTPEEDNFPHRVCGELLLLQAQCSMKSSERKMFAIEAMRHFSLASVACIDYRIISCISTLLSLTEMHVENALVVGHAALRYATLSLVNNNKSKEKKTFIFRNVLDIAVW